MQFNKKVKYLANLMETLWATRTLVNKYAQNLKYYKFTIKKNF